MPKPKTTPGIVTGVAPRRSATDALGYRRSYAGYVTVALPSGTVHTFIDGSINAAPEALHRVGAKCLVGWMTGGSYSLPFVTGRVP
jgi:hypothetical protein